MRRKRPTRLAIRPSFRAEERRRTIRIGLIGVGTVGTGTIKVLLEHKREIQRRLGCKLELKTICSRSIHKRDL